MVPGPSRTLTRTPPWTCSSEPRSWACGRRYGRRGRAASCSRVPAGASAGTSFCDSFILLSFPNRGDRAGRVSGRGTLPRPVAGPPGTRTVSLAGSHAASVLTHWEDVCARTGGLTMDEASFRELLDRARRRDEQAAAELVR